MQNAPVRSVFSEITDFLATNPSPEEAQNVGEYKCWRVGGWNCRLTYKLTEPVGL
jgi:hypothetical protein